MEPISAALQYGYNPDRPASSLFFWNRYGDDGIMLKAVEVSGTMTFRYYKNSSGDFLTMTEQQLLGKLAEYVAERLAKKA